MNLMMTTMMMTVIEVDSENTSKFYLIYYLLLFNLDEPDVDEEPAVDGKRFMMSVITASPPQEDDNGNRFEPIFKNAAVTRCHLGAL